MDPVTAFTLAAACLAFGILAGSIAEKGHSEDAALAAYHNGYADGINDRDAEGADVLERVRQRIRRDDAAHAASGDGAPVYDMATLRALGHGG